MWLYTTTNRFVTADKNETHWRRQTNVSKTLLFETFPTFGRLRKMMSINLYLLAVLILAYSALNIQSQNIEEQKDQRSILGNIKIYPVIYGAENDELPERIKGRGVVVEITKSFVICGTIGWNGTAKIKLLKKSKNYRHEYVYVAAWCGFTRDENLNKIIEFNLSKLKDGELPGGGAINTIDSGGVAFYRFNKILSPK